MINKIRVFLKKDIIKIFSLNAVSTLISMLTGFISVKVVATLVGPAGIALLGQLSNFTSILLTLSTGGINAGVTKYIAQHFGSEKEIRNYIHTAVVITFFLSLVCGIITVCFSSYFSLLILKDRQHSSIIMVFGFTVIFYSFNSLLVSILNGFREFRKMVIINIAGSITGLLFSIILAFNYGVYGALISAVTYQSVVIFITILIASRSDWFNKLNFLGQFKNSAALKLGHYSLMALVSAATVPVSQLIIRGYIVKETSLRDAGIWEGMNRLSSMYLMVITTSLTIYYLPKLSGLTTQSALGKEIRSTFKTIMIPLVFITLTIYLLRNIIIQILFNHKFDGMEKLFLFQLIGDLFKISSWILAYQMIAKSMTKLYIITEIVFSLLVVGLSVLFVNIYGNIGATIGFAAAYILYFLTMLFIFRKIVIPESNA